LLSGNTIAVTTGDTRVNIFVDDVLTENIPAIQVVGNNGNAGLQLDVLIAPENSVIGDPGSPIGRDANNFAGLTFADTEQRNRSRVVISLNGNLTGPVTAGIFHRLDVRDSIEAAGDVTATRLNPLGQFNSIFVVRAGRYIDGDITAVQGSIERVRVVNLVLPVNEHGIRGNIIADQGIIQSMASTGNIGSASAPVIRGRTIRSIFTGNADVGTLSNASVNADIRTSSSASSPIERFCPQQLRSPRER